jgi:hypothetical protein
MSASIPGKREPRSVPNLLRSVMPPILPLNVEREYREIYLAALLGPHSMDRSGGHEVTATSQIWSQ